ncbi:lipopolysaccharide biosynthesis protein [Sphingosinicella rhizophila]|uniref:Lipopolysaccharide biosynthesis protein n=1 Tax=Sphingosinicella rhizophila TaxID=3050082 RepID=A0ABU3Q865_9SPHN|nr:lipopolysaccharide biosynthesis protein [Sphingosinicella sp. GR2756]MDT9599602.1 lipopolysaccharide biosynthesis protein [Sphingosinicella sp. GR2756]
MSAAVPAGNEDIAALAKGGRTNFFGFLLRLAARLPFLFVAGRLYGADALGRFAYAVLIVEFAAQIATLGLKRGLAQQLSTTERPHVCVVWDAMLVALLASAAASAILFLFPQAMFPNSPVRGVEWLLPLIVFAVAGSDVALAALAYQHNVKATVTARAIVEPWTLSIAATLLYFTLSQRDGLIIAYVLSMIAALLASLWPLYRSYGLPRGWRPEIVGLWALARRNTPLAVADAIEWGSRRLDIAILGLFFSPAIVGIYYVAQQVASLPQKLKTSFDPILSPVITQKLAEGDKKAVAKQIRQVGFWIIAAQTGVALALGIPGEAVMGLVGAAFVGGTGALAFLLAAEVIAATAAVSEGALVFVARHKNLMISTAMIAVQGILSVALILGMKALGWPESFQAAGPALALMLALSFASVLKARLLRRILGAPVQGWRWPLVWAAGAAIAVGYFVTLLPPSWEWAELVFGIPLILLAFGSILWTKGFTHEDRVLFRKHDDEPEDISLPPPPGVVPPVH